MQFARHFMAGIWEPGEIDATTALWWIKVSNSVDAAAAKERSINKSCSYLFGHSE